MGVKFECTLPSLIPLLKLGMFHLGIVGVQMDGHVCEGKTACFCLGLLVRETVDIHKRAQTRPSLPTPPLSPHYHCFP